jgi:hypothetical protein
MDKLSGIIVESTWPTTESRANLFCLEVYVSGSMTAGHQGHAEVAGQWQWVVGGSSGQ